VEFNAFALCVLHEIFCRVLQILIEFAPMNILVIGSGGREHALVWKLAQSRHVTRLWCAPGNAGISTERLLKNAAPVGCAAIGVEDLSGLLSFAKEQKVDLTVVGPDNPLALGIVDFFQHGGLRIWGPNRRASQFEASKAFAQSFMERHGIPTARAGTFTNPKAAKEFAASTHGRVAVKADGLALGKGVVICTSLQQATEAIEDILVKKSFGAAGNTVVLQELLEGPEISLHALCDGKVAKLFPTAQDHKRALDNDQGLNTGGMGAFSPVPTVNQKQIKELEQKILEPWVRGCAEEGIVYQGILYPGIMLTKDGPKVLEFNARFGDPETQVLLTRLENDLVELFEASLEGTLDRQELRWKSDTAVCVVMASSGYPGKYEKGKPIQGLDQVAQIQGTKVFHAGTAKVGDQTVTNGGRVLGVTAWARDLPSARQAAYEAVGQIHFEGAHFRGDIGAK
jgi:phosphoribosylamine--glycine ligase